MAAEPNLDIDNNDLSPLGTPDDGDGASLEAEEDPECLPDQPNASDPPPPKRKGGRKPIYATVEERKQRNRQAQAAFRERRSEYIKELEATLKEHEKLLQLAQRDRQASLYHSSFMQRRVSTLERILRENGIDVDAELRARGEHTGLHHEPPLLPGSFQVASGTGTLRPMKQGGTTGNTKLDVLKSKAASARNSMISPVNSPQSQSSLWNDTSPSSSTMASPLGVTYSSPAAALYNPTQGNYPGVLDPHHHHRRPSGNSIVHDVHTGTLPVSGVSDPHMSTRQMPPPMQQPSVVHPHMEWHPRYLVDWDMDRNVHQDDNAPAAKPAGFSGTKPAANLADSGKHRSHYAQSTSKPRPQPFESADLTMPEGFSQEIFPLSYGNSAFPSNTSGAPKRDARMSS